jgi:hypothetical protein
MTNTNKMLLVAGIMLALIIGATYALADDTIRECQQADGSIMYTNKPKMGCTELILPELAVIAHNKDYAAIPAAPITSVLREVPAIHDSTLHSTDFRIADSNELTSVCKLYHQWIALQLRTHGGFEHNRVEDTQQRFGYTTIFGSGYPPAGC